jgi:hypothetical protein
MPKFEISTSIVLEVPVKIVVEADSKDDALDMLSGSIPMNASEAHDTRNKGWKATAQIKPPKGESLILTSDSAKASIITATSGSEKIKKVAG